MRVPLTGVVALTAVVSGCAISPAAPIGAEVLSSPLAVVVSSDLPPANQFGAKFGQRYDPEARQKAAVMAIAGTAALAGVVAAAIAACPLCAPMFLQALAPAAVEVGIFGMAATASALAPDPLGAQRDALKSALDTQASELGLARRMADAMAREAGAVGGAQIDVRDAPLREGEDRLARYHGLRDAGYPYALDLRVGRFGILPFTADRFTVYVVAEAQLVKTATGGVAWLRGLVYESSARPADAWLADGGAAMRAELLRGSASLGERAFDLIVLRAEGSRPKVDEAPVCGGFSPRPNSGADCAMPDPATTGYGCGVPLLDPGAAGGPAAATGPRPPTATADSTTPLLRWDALPQGAGSEWAAMRDRRYDLRIWSVRDDEPGDLVYERLGLTDTGHRVEAPLEGSATYYWSVRLRAGTVSGEPRATVWSAWKAPALTTLPSLRETRVGGVTTPQLLVIGPAVVCPVLDFIPAANFHRFATP